MARHRRIVQSVSSTPAIFRKSILFAGLIVVISSIVILFTACEKKARVNPFDPSGDVNFTPQNVEIAQSSVTSVTLTWELDDMNIDGFKVDKRTGTGDWVSGYALVENDIREWTDEGLDPNVHVYYRLYAYAGDNTGRYSPSSVIIGAKPSSLFSGLS